MNNDNAAARVPAGERDVTAGTDGKLEAALAGLPRSKAGDLRARLDALHRREREHVALQEHAIVSIADRHGVIEYANDRFCAISGYPREELLGRSHRVLKSGVHPPEFYADMWRIIGAGGIWKGEVCNRRKDGGLYWVASTIVPFVDEDGRPYQYVSIRTDITPVKNAEAGLRTTLESTQDGILAIDGAGRVVFANRRFREIWRLPDGVASPGSERERVLEHVMQRVSDPRAFGALIRELSGSDRDSLEIVELVDGRILEHHSRAMRDEGRVTGRVCTFHDITARRRAEQAAEHHKERLRRGQIYANIGTWDSNLRTGELFWTERIAPLFGYPEGNLETTYENFLNGVHPEDRQRVLDARDACIERDVPYLVEHRVIWPDGTVRWLLERGAVVRDADGRPLQMLGVVQDIDDRKAAEAALVVARDEADRANRAKSEFLSSMSHELRTPMNAILGFGQLIECDDTLPAEHRDHAREILKAGQHLLTLIDEVLDLAKIESGRVDLSLEPVDVGPLVEECLRLVSTRAAQRNLRMGYDGLAGRVVRADRTRLKQALLNLLSNAVKYNRDGGSVQIDAVADRDWAVIRVADTGPGIPKARMHELFQPFNRLDAEHSGIEGTGIGLSITRRIVELMGGTLEVASAVGAGSCFSIRLPLDDSSGLGGQEGGDAPGRRGIDAPAVPAVRRSVLYIEDNPANLKLVTQVLARRPHLKLWTANTPELGIELAITHRPELILLDINMPVMDGYEVLEILRADPRLRPVPVVAVTANAMPRDMERGRAAGFVDYLTKPLDIGRLLEVADTWCARPHGPR